MDIRSDFGHVKLENTFLSFRLNRRKTLKDEISEVSKFFQPTVKLGARSSEFFFTFCDKIMERIVEQLFVFVT
jgi:hypothetical protein